MILRFLRGFAACAAMALAAPLAVHAAQRQFATPEQAGAALNEAVRDADRKAIAAILGPGSADVIDSGDPAEDMVGRARFAAAYRQSSRIEPAGRARADLVIGEEAWHFPFPLVHEAAGWRFDARAGRGEVIRRRIGRNELAAMQALLAYVDAQREYALSAHDGVGPGVYAQRIASAPGRHDGLYWIPTRLEGLSPLGVLFTLAAVDENGAQAQPYHGYLLRLLRGQGRHAQGGAMSYSVNGRMIGGFALLAYPVRHRVSGVRSFIVSHEGRVYSRDLGLSTASVARAMREFDPGPGWRLESEAVAASHEDPRMASLAGSLACTLCHREAPAPREAGDAPPLAPTFREIASRYRHDPKAEERLTHEVIEGIDPADRHWKDRADFTRMGANAPRVTPDEARALVRWILGSR